MDLPLPSVIPDAQPGGTAFNVFQHIMNVSNALKKGQIENQLAPLESAVKAQNALSYGNRTGNIGLFLRGIAQMPAKERQAYLADPRNRSQYMNMLDQFKSSMNNPLSSGQIITPELLNRSGLGGNSNGNENGNAMNSIPEAMNQSPSNAFNDSNPMPEQLSRNNNALNEDPNQTDYNIASDNQQPSIDIMKAASMASTEPMASTDQDLIPAPKISQNDRALLNAQMRDNENQSGSVQSNRAKGAATLDRFLMDNRPEFKKVFSDAVKYSQFYGKGKKLLDGLKKNQPEEYANLIFFQKKLRNDVANQIKFQEKMGATNTQLEHAADMLGAVDDMFTSPDTAMRVMNKSISSMFKLSDAIYNVAETAHPGVYKKLFQIPTLKGDYIPQSMREEGTPKSSRDIMSNPVSDHAVSLLAKSIELPKFDSKEKFKEWYRQQPKITQDAIRHKLRGN